MRWVPTLPWLPSLRFYALVGEKRAFFARLQGTAARTHHAPYTSMITEGMGPSMAVEGATTSRVFDTYVERVLDPALRCGQVVVMDNLGAHRPRRIREL